jgi:hypothetical protein
MASEMARLWATGLARVMATGMAKEMDAGDGPGDGQLDAQLG